MMLVYMTDAKKKNERLTQYSPVSISIHSFTFPWTPLPISRITMYRFIILLPVTGSYSLTSFGVSFTSGTGGGGGKLADMVNVDMLLVDVFREVFRDRRGGVLEVLWRDCQEVEVERLGWWDLDL
jgi:hypothetical protein